MDIRNSVWPNVTLGRLHQLRGEFAEAIPYLLASRKKLNGTDLVAADEALVVSYLKTGRPEEARRIVDNGHRPQRTMRACTSACSPIVCLEQTNQASHGTTFAR